MKFIMFILKTLLDRVPIIEQQNGITLVKVEGIRDLENFIEFNDLKIFLMHANKEDYSHGVH